MKCVSTVGGKVPGCEKKSTNGGLHKNVCVFIQNPKIVNLTQRFPFKLDTLPNSHFKVLYTTKRSIELLQILETGLRSNWVDKTDSNK